jgi:N-methylhydantoinase B/oxoprolinase/acetone carboxylase alpha subunit
MSRSSTSSRRPAGQCRRHAPDRGARAGGIAAVGGVSRAGGRLHRDHPADDRRDLLRRAQAAPERVVANAYGTINALSLAGKRANGQRWVMFSFFGGGHGGSIESDGLNHGNAPISTATIPPMEILEAAYPVMFRQWALRPDSAGAGRASRRPGRGLRDRGAGGKREAFLFGERGRFPPQGRRRRRAGAMNVFITNRRRLARTAAGLQDAGDQAEAGAGGAAGDARRRRLRPPRIARPRPWPATWRLAT